MDRSPCARFDWLTVIANQVLICFVTVFCSRQTIRRTANYVRQRVSTSSIFDPVMRDRGVPVGQRDAEVAHNLLPLGDGRTLDRHDETPTSVGWIEAMKEPIFQVNYSDSTRNLRPSIRQNRANTRNE